MTKEQFKTKWESNVSGGGITYNDIADCAVAWEGLSLTQRLNLCVMLCILCLKLRVHIMQKPISQKMMNNL